MALESGISPSPANVKIVPKQQTSACRKPPHLFFFLGEEGDDVIAPIGEGTRCPRLFFFLGEEGDTDKDHRGRHRESAASAN